MNTPEDLTVNLADHPDIYLRLSYYISNQTGNHFYQVRILTKSSPDIWGSVINVVENARTCMPILDISCRYKHARTLILNHAYFEIANADTPKLLDWLKQCRAYERALGGLCAGSSPPQCAEARVAGDRHESSR